MDMTTALKNAAINAASTVRLTPYGVAHDLAHETIREVADVLGGWLPSNVVFDEKEFRGIRVNPRD